MTAMLQMKKPWPASTTTSFHSTARRARVEKLRAATS